MNSVIVWILKVLTQESNHLNINVIIKHFPNFEDVVVLVY